MAGPLSQTEAVTACNGIATADGRPPAVFCSYWPIAKRVLKALAKSESVWVRMAVRIVIQVGNVLHTQCKA